MTSTPEHRAPEGGSPVSEMQLIELLHSCAPRFWAKVAVKAPNECWEWTGWKIPAKTSRLPYGKWRPTGKHTLLATHRVAWMLTSGPIPAGCCVCHKCDNPSCCNPDHLWIGSPEENNKDRHKKGRTVPPKRVLDHGKFSRGSKHGMSKLTESDVLAIKKDSRPHKVIAREYGVHRTNIGHIKCGKTWRTVNA